MAVLAYTHAATVTTANDFVTTLNFVELSNHDVVFTTPTGAAEGDTIVIEFDPTATNGFGTASITEDDVDIEDDGVDLSTAADCSGAEQAGVSMAGDILTVTICAGDGGAIAPGSSVSIKVGTNATDSGTGTNQITNPSDDGTYYLNITGSFGDSGSIALPISVSDDSISVTATVPAAPGGGGGGGGGGDISGPFIFNVAVSNITGSSATITWDTDENADSKVDYGLTSAYGSTVTDNSLVTSHSITLTGLSSGTTYHFRVRSADLAGNESATGDFTFTTVDDSAPFISNVQAVDITETSARITWDTDENATSQVDYGTTAGYGSTVSDGTLVTSHSMLLTGLTAGTLYHFRVQSQDASLNTATSGDFTFTTLSNPPPSNVGDLTVTPGDGQNVLSWTNPSDPDFAGVRVNVCTDTFPSGPFDPDCTVVFDGLANGFTHTGLTNGTTYFYGVYSRDSSGQFASGALGSGTPSAPEEEPPAEEPPPAAPPPEEPPGPEPGPPPSGPRCGDGVCSNLELTERLCPVDCMQEPTPQGPTCGNAVCEEGESTSSCPDDCVPGLPPSQVLESDLEVFVASGAIELRPTSSGVWRVLSRTVVRVQLLARNITKPVDRVVLTVGRENFLMAPNFGEVAGEADLRSAALDDPAYVATFTSGEPGEYPSAVTVTYGDGTSQSVSFAIQALGPGKVFTMSEGTVTPIAGAKVTLLEAGTDSPWDGSPYGQFNPVTTASDGTFAWYAPNGTYEVRAEAAGYASTNRNVVVDENIVNPSVAVVPEEVIPLPEEEQPVVPLPPQLEGPIQALNETLGAIREIPGVQEAAEAAIPVLAVTAAASSLALIFAFDLLPFLQYLFTAPILLFARRKRRGFGIVYNSISKVPIDLAVVRLFELPADGSKGRLVASRVTDRGGRYFFTANPGRYRIEASKTGFTFPSDYLRDKRADGDYLDIYHAEPIVVTEKDAVIAANIPLDPSQAAAFHKPANVIWKARLRVIQNVVAALGFILSSIVAILHPSWFAVAMVFVQLAVLMLVRVLAKPRRTKNWGIVYDKRTGRPLSNAVARVFEPRYNKLLETTVTDAKGRYGFVLGPNQYFAVFEKPGYQTVEVRPIDFSKSKEPVAFGQKISLQKTEETPGRSSMGEPAGEA
jgi:hypothetical protein